MGGLGPEHHWGLRPAHTVSSSGWARLRLKPRSSSRARHSLVVSGDRSTVWEKATRVERAGETGEGAS